MYPLILRARRSVELQKWLNLRVSVQNVFSAFPNSFSSTAAGDGASPIDGRQGQKFTVSYLVDSFGLTTKLAESISRKVRSEGKGNPDSVLNLLRSYGFTDSQISSIVKEYPLLLMLDAEKSLGPKLKFLESRGTSTSELTQIVSTVPKIMGMRWDKAISRYYDFVKEIIEVDKSSKYVKLCHSLNQGSHHENKFRNVLVLRELGVPQKNLFSLLISNHALVCGKEKFEESLKKVVEMGFDPTTSKFVEALRVVYYLSDKKLEEKVDFLYKRLGLSVGDVWSVFKIHPLFLALSDKNILNSIETFRGLGFNRDEVVMMVKRFPSCFGSSAESVKKKTEFLVVKMNWPIKALAVQPQVLGLSMEKRIVPRCNVIKALISKGLLRDGGTELPPMSSVLLCTDQVFLNRYAMKHVDKNLLPELMSIFKRDYKTHLEQ